MRVQRSDGGLDSVISFLKSTSILTLFQAFGTMTRALKGVSEDSRVVLALEGGYDPRGVADCVVEVVAAMAERTPDRAADELLSGTRMNRILNRIFRFDFTHFVSLLTTGCSSRSAVAGEPTHARRRERNERAS